jgi:ABC-2 type transport system ATP-binding protein
MPTPQPHTVHCNRVTRRYSGRAAVDAVTFTIDGGICAFLGPNGAGKSTLFKLLAGLESADAGTLQIAGLDVRRDAAQLKQIIGVLPDQLGLFEPLTLLENLRCVGPIYGLSADETLARANSLLTLLDLDNVRHTLASESSYGMRKKTALAMALLHNPRVLILDEPFEGIDPSSSRTIEQALLETARRGVTILLTSHLLPLVERFASRILLMKHGAIAWDSAAQPTDISLEAIYFSLIGEPAKETPSWLG